MATGLIRQCLESLNREREAEDQIAISESTPLLAEGSALDSLAFLSFSSDLEERLRALTGKNVALIARALASEDEPFRNVEALERFIVSLYR